MRDPYFYDDINVLKNRLNIREQAVLDDAEADYVSFRIKQLAMVPLPGNYSASHYMEMHRFLFQDLYEWAGNQRTINIYKEEAVLGGLSIDYSDVFDIESDLKNALAKMNGRNWGSMNKKQIAEAFCEDLAAIWKIHCFREGNTRTTICFCCQYADEKGFPLNRELFEDNSAYVRTSLVAYNAVFSDLGDISKKEYLNKIVWDALTV